MCPNARDGACRCEKPRNPPQFIFACTAMTRFVQAGMRYAFLVVAVALVACAEHGGTEAVIEDGTYSGRIRASGCMTNTPLTIEVLDGKASFPAGDHCQVNESTAAELHYDCTSGGRESLNLCYRNNTSVI